MNIFIRSTKCSKLTIPKCSKRLYKNTINQPKFPFAIHPSSELRETVNSKWNEFFLKQRKSTQRPTFILHDGPPYANGCLHMGHALNKFLKDVTIRYKILCGYQVNFVPGWDCHGLPIELKAEHELSAPSVSQIRAKANTIASHYIQSQKASFLSLGVLGEWDQSYATMNPSYEAAELIAFSELHSKNLIYRHVLPVYWSGTSRTALAESELDYNTEHVSRSLYLKVKLKNTAHRLSSLFRGNSNTYGVIWTTTPWTLPANEAVLYDPDSRYLCLKAVPSEDFYVVGKMFLERFISMLPGQKLTVLDEFSGSQLEGLLYEHPIRGNSFCMPFLPSSHVMETIGTGLVHCAPCHGREDFEVGCKFSLPLNLLVDESACFKTNAHPRLAGLSVLGDGNEKVLEMVKPMTLLVENLKHSYPYDWRTKTPIITLLSDQWFVDTERLADSAMESYQTIDVIPPNHKPSMLPFLISRPPWCISRQRSWGVPIPVLFRATDSSPIVDYQFIKHIADRVAQCGTDFWFLEPIRELVPEQYLSKWSVSCTEVTKGTDVFDVWFDSGLSWLCAMDAFSSRSERVADLYLEGPDQFRGWFSASLLLSVAFQKKSPYRKLVVHGFTADSEGRKMSKSLGNVVSPEQLIQEQKGCVDVLRRWAAFSGLDAVCSVGSKEIGQHASSYRMLRNSFRFLLGNLYDFDPLEQYRRLTGEYNAGLHTTSELVLHLGQLVSNLKPERSRMTTLDLAVLCWLGKIVSLGLDHAYPNYRFDNLLSEVDQLVSRLSSIYFTSVKDVIYCDSSDSPRRRAIQTIFWLTVECFKLLLAPLLPYLTEEVEEVCARRWPIGALASQQSMSLLERVSDNKLVSAFSDPPNTDWMVCMNMMRDWERHDVYADAVELVYRFYRSCIGVLESRFVSGLPEGSAVKHFRSSHISIICAPHQSNIHSCLEMLHPDREAVSGESSLCQLFRCASIHWLVQDNPKTVQGHGITHDCPVTFQGMDLLVRLESVSATNRCPRCMRYTRWEMHELCQRCTDVVYPTVNNSTA